LACPVQSAIGSGEQSGVLSAHVSFCLHVGCGSRSVAVHLNTGSCIGMKYNFFSECFSGFA